MNRKGDKRGLKRQKDRETEKNRPSADKKIRFKGFVRGKKGKSDEPQGCLALLSTLLGLDF